MIAEYSRSIHSDDVRKYEAEHPYIDEGVDYPENPAWALVKTLKKKRPYEPSDFIKIPFIRDPYQN